MGVLCSEPFHHANLVKTRENPFAAGCAVGYLTVWVQESLSPEFSQGEQGLACFLIHLSKLLT